MKNLKKFLTVFIFTIAVAVFALAYSASAEIVEYGDITFDTETGTITRVARSCRAKVINIPSEINGITVRALGDFSLDELMKVETINIPATVEYIGDGISFRNFYLKEIYVDDNNPYYCDIDGVLYDKDVTTLISYPPLKTSDIISFPKTVTKLGDDSIYYLRNVDTFDISNITSLGAGVFTGLQCNKMIVNSDLLEYGKNPFYDDRQSGVINIIDHVYFTGNTPGLWADILKPYCSNFTYNYDGRFKGEYELNGGTLYFDEETGTITGSIGISELDIPAEINGIKIVAIADNAFRNDSFLSVTIPGSIKTIEDRTFFDTNIAYLTISEGVEEIGELAFFNNQTLKSLTIPSSVKTVSIGAFEDNLLKELVISDGVEVIEKDAFYSIYNSIENLTIPGSVKTIGYNAFGECMKLKSLILEDGIGTIGDYAFCCNNITELVIPQSVKSVGAGAFEMCDSLESVTYYSTTVVDDTAFNYCDSLKNINIIEYTEKLDPSLSVNGLAITVHNLNGVKDYFIGKGIYNTYREVKNNSVMRVTEARINGANEYTYTVKEPGDYTVCVRFNDGSENVMLYTTATAVLPKFNVKGTMITVSRLDGLIVLRAAPGEWNTPGEVKRAEGSYNIPARNISGNEYVLNFTESGTYTVTLEYSNGLVVVEHIELTKIVPTLIQDGNVVTIGNVEDLYTLRYAKGEYQTMGEIKRAEGCQVRRNRDVQNGSLTVRNLKSGTYTFCVQYTDNSYHYFTVVVE